jgi:hypothetical protein
MHTMRREFILWAVEKYDIDSYESKNIFITSALNHIQSDELYQNPFELDLTLAPTLNRFEYTMTVWFVLKATPYIYDDYFIFDYNNV